MARRSRRDEAGSWHHVYNRALARRPLFLCRADYRYFLACLADVVRLRLIEVHAHALMRTHFHLLVRSLAGRLAEAMKRVENSYSRYLNRRLKRDGSLWRGRFGSARLRSAAYRRAVVSYIDTNPVAAGAAARPQDFPFCSAHAYSRERRPQWLNTDWVEGCVLEATGRPASDIRAYTSVFPVLRSTDFCQWVERRLRLGGEMEGGDHLLDAEPPCVRDWLRRKAQLADGAGPEAPATSPAALFGALAVARKETRRWTFAHDGHRMDALNIATCGLLRDACGLSYREVAHWAGCSIGTAHARVEAHRIRVRSDEGYAARTAELVSYATRLLLHASV